jgi:hypothetical protein
VHVFAWDQHVITADQVIQDPATQLFLVVVVDQNGSVYNTAYVRTMKAAVNQVDYVLALAAGAAKIITKVVKIGGHGDINMVLHGAQQFVRSHA